jgi:hypothetical protein
VHKSIVLQFTLPPNYPSHSNPAVNLVGLTLSKSRHHELQNNLNEILSALSSSSDERLLEIIETFSTFLISPGQATEPAEPARPVIPMTTQDEAPIFIILIWFHHLLSTIKRKSILKLDSLRGISKPGYPGILVLQGPKDTLDEAVMELKGMKWQAMQVRAEIECNSILEQGIHEVETVAEVVERMGSLGLGDWCLSALRMK